MVKFINILFVCFFLFGCRKDKVELPIMLGEEYAFLIGEWEWKISIVPWSITSGGGNWSSKFFIHKEQGSAFCTLNFVNDGSLVITNNISTTVKKLKPYGIIDLGANKVVHFLSDSGEEITFSYSEATNCLNTEFTFFTLPPLPCNLGLVVLNNRYDKI